MTDTQNIPWKRISVEAVAIVASILLAFAIDAWWAERQEREFEQETLAALSEEFQGHQAELLAARRGHEFMLDSIGHLMAYAKTGVYPSDQISIDRSMNFLRMPFTSDLGSGVRDALISSGQIEVISDKGLRFELAEWSSVLDELKDDQQHGVTLVFDFVLPYMMREGVPVPGFRNIAPDGQLSAGSRSLAADPVTQKRIFNDPEFLSILETRHGFLKHTITEYDDLIVATESIIAKIEASIND